MGLRRPFWRPAERCDFCLNGLIGADRQPHPHYYEVQKAYQPIHITLSPTGQVKVTNRHHFTDLSEFEWSWTQSLDGLVAASGVVESPKVAPGESGTFEIPLENLAMGTARLQTMEVKASLHHATSWAPAGWPVASEQLLLREEAPALDVQESNGTLSVTEDERTVVVSSEATQWTWNRETGRLVRWSQDSQPVLAGELFCSFWKPANRNQAGNGYDERHSVWRDASKPRRPKAFSILREDDRVIVSIRHDLPIHDAQVEVRYTAHASGQLQVAADYTPPTKTAPSLPRFGLECEMNGPVESVAWLGRGPHENYPDRCQSARLGRYELPLSQFHTNYIYPQDNGARTGVRRRRLGSPSGPSLQIDAEQPLIARVWPYTTAALEAASHRTEIALGEATTVHLDAAIHGVGGDNSWGKRTMNKYRVPAKEPLVLSVLLTPNAAPRSVATDPER